MSVNVIEFPKPPGSNNKQCPVCRNEWWIVDAVVMDNDLHISGFAGIPECHTCSLPDPLTIVKGDGA